MHQFRRPWTAPALAIAAAALGAGCATTPATTAASPPQATAKPLITVTPLTTATEHRAAPSVASRPTAVSQGIGGSRDSSHRAGSSGQPAAGVALPAATTRATSAAAGVGIPVTHQPPPPVAVVPPPVAAVPPPVVVAPPPVGGGHGGGTGGGRAAAPALPADFPRAVPIPPGTLLGGSGSAGQWGVLVLAAGPADRVLKSAVAFYVAAGYTADGPAIVHRGIYRVTIVAENRDHSNTQTNLALGVTRT